VAVVDPDTGECHICQRLITDMQAASGGLREPSQFQLKVHRAHYGRSKDS
jgi:hypothetical protein